MLNYMKAELYKITRQKWFSLGLSLLLLCEGALFAAFWLSPGGENWDFSQSAFFICSLLPVGFFLIYPLGSLIFSDQYKHRTLKNELSFGLSRVRIYLGKFFAAALVCLLTCALAVVFGLGLSWVLFPKNPWSETAECLLLLGRCLLVALPLWLGSLSLLHMLCFTIKSTTVVAYLYGGYFVFFPVVLSVLGILSDRATPILQLERWQLGAPLAHLSGDLTLIAAWAWLVGIGWLVATMLIGLGTFWRRDIK